MRNFSTILEILDRNRDSEDTVLVCGEEKLTFRQFAKRAEHVAGGLMSEGVKKGDRVLFSMHRSADALCACFGILYAGASYVAVDPDWPKERRDFAIGDAGTVFSMTDEACHRLLNKEIPSGALPEVSGVDEAAVYYTSGSTGRPKGVVLRHAVFGSAFGFFSGEDTPEDAPYTEWRVLQCISGLSFIAPIVFFSVVLMQKKTFVLPTDQEMGNTGSLVLAMKLHNVDALVSTPSAVLRFMDDPGFAVRLAGLKLVGVIGELLTPSAAQRISRATGGVLVDAYGLSEMMYCAEYMYRGDGAVHLGKAGYGVCLYVLDNRLEETLPNNEGELFIGGTPAEYGHYLNSPELDAQRYAAHPRFGRLFRTGDLARVESDGSITLLGRRDDMVKLRGQRIALGEIENAMMDIVAIRRAAVRLTKEKSHEMLVGYYTAAQDVPEEELRRSLAGRLPGYMVPSIFVRLSSMPENVNGKLDYRALPPVFPSKKEYAPPATKKEKLLCKIFAEVTKAEAPVGVNDSFFAIGGDSISAMAAASHLEKEGLAFQLHQLFDAPTARKLARLLVPVTIAEDREEESVLPEPGKKQREAIDRKVGWENVECVYPVTGVVAQKLSVRATWMQYALFEIDAEAIIPEDMKERLSELTAKHQILRSVFLCGDMPLQVVLREHTPEFFSVDLRSLGEGEGLSGKQKAYFRNLIRLQPEDGKDLERDVLFTVGLIRISEARSVLYLAYSHLLLDGAGMARIVWELTEPVEILPDRDVWRRRILRLQKEAVEKLPQFAKERMEGSRVFKQIPASDRDTKELRPEIYHAAGGKKLLEQAAKYCRDHDVTLAVLLHYVFARTLMEVLSVDDVCFYSVGSGRTAEDMELPGMFVVSFPLCLGRSDSIADCRDRLFSAAAGASARDASKADLCGETESGGVLLNIQNFYADYGNVIRRIELFELSETIGQNISLLEGILATAKETQWYFLVETKGRLDGTSFYDGGIHSAGLTKRLALEFIRQLRCLIGTEI